MEIYEKESISLHLSNIPICGYKKSLQKGLLSAVEMVRSQGLEPWAR